MRTGTIKLDIKWRDAAGNENEIPAGSTVEASEDEVSEQSENINAIVSGRVVIVDYFEVDWDA